MVAAALAPALSLPPAYRLTTLREHGDAVRHACRIAPEEGAGAFVWVRRFDVLEFAVVLEPEEALASARRAVFAGMSAIVEALAAFVPPEKPVTLTWPATVQVDGGRLGGARLAWPEGCAEDAVPDWLVFGAQLLAVPVRIADTGAHPAVTWLQEEGFEADEHGAVIESFARHLMVAFDAWADRGFEAVAETYLARLPKHTAGERRGIDGNGDLLIHRAGGVERVPLLGPLREAAWFDPATGLPRID
ncbi:MAG TPA: biotin/lipoate--protein ligase family protein [Microvirga sp.]|jgi:hypothetical protein|nr:biotin/lipoate--protein ligase family protein [Microvirga sp.]